MNSTSQPQLAQPSTLWELIVKYNAIHATVDRMGKELLKLMRHPEATAEQIDEGRLKYFLTYTRWVEARMVLREKHPPHPLLPLFIQKELPWNKPEEN